MVLVRGGEVCTMPATTGTSLVEMAAQQQRQIDAHQRELSARQQHLQSLKQREARLTQEHHKAQEQKLHQLKAQLDHQLSSNNNYNLELERVRTLFIEKEKELSAAAARVEDLTRQLEHIHQAAGWLTSSSTPLDLDKLRRELMYRQKLSEQQATRITQQKETFAKRKHELSIMDQKIADLQQRLHKKRLHNQQMTKQSSTTKNLQGPEINCSQDDIHAKFSSTLDHFAPSKNDPKYQTLPYNTKFPPPKSDANSSTSYETNTNSHNASTNTTNEEDSNDTPLQIESKLQNSKKENDLNSTSITTSSDGFIPLISPPIYSSKGNIFKNNGTTFALKATLIKQPPSQHAKTASPPPLPKSNNVIKLQTQEPSNSLPSTAPPPPPPPPEKPLTKKPVVPPKPAKPLALRMGAMPNSTADSVDAALSVLKNSTIDSTTVTASEGKTPPLNFRERLLYYQCVQLRYPIRFGKKDQQSGKGSDTETTPTEDAPEPNIAMIDLPPRHGPIRAKPLTIKKHLGEQPPRLKSSSFKRCPPLPSEPQHSRTLPAAFLFPDKITTPPSSTLVKPSQHPCNDLKPATSKEDDVISQLVADIEKATNDIVLESPTEEPALVERTDGDGDSAASSGANASTPDDSATPPLPCLCRALENKKGNLKTTSTSSTATKRVRRVSFDPLALLLDAALEGELELVMKTAQEVPNPSAANDEGITALHNAICAGHLDIVTFLVDFGCDVNSQDSDGWTPLHCAASCNNLPMVKFLVEKGACIFAATFSDQETAAEKCEEDEEGFDGCSEYLYSIQEQLGVVNDGTVYAVFDYTAQNEDELSFKDGDKLLVLRRGDDTERLWWWCRHHTTGAEGYVPRNLLGLYPRLSHQSTA